MLAWLLRGAERCCVVGGLGARTDGNVKRVLARKIELKSLILAQIERWRHALHMQVERQRGVTWRRAANG